MRPRASGGVARIAASGRGQRSNDTSLGLVRGWGCVVVALAIVPWRSWAWRCTSTVKPQHASGRAAIGPVGGAVVAVLKLFEGVEGVVWPQLLRIGHAVGLCGRGYQVGVHRELRPLFR